MRLIRRLVYKMGFRPKPGTIFFSPSIALAIQFREDFKKELNRDRPER